MANQSVQDSVSIKLLLDDSNLEQNLRESQKKIGLFAAETQSILNNLAAAKPLTDLSTALGVDAASAAKVAATAMNAFGMQAKDMTGIADVLTVAVSHSGMSLDDAAGALGTHSVKRSTRR
ncbi:MAG: phage tail tape measure protein [Planctomycetota bacterium]|jgi:TP901 family phage tail tape measure protein|nr:phage tail tape measure protein [Planctomycetota bacterium]